MHPPPFQYFSVSAFPNLPPSLTTTNDHLSWFMAVSRDRQLLAVIEQAIEVKNA
jgi:hypothetical protein